MEGQHFLQKPSLPEWVTSGKGKHKEANSHTQVKHHLTARVTTQVDSIIYITYYISEAGGAEIANPI